MENQEINQSVFADIVELNETPKKECKTCNSSKKLSTNNVLLLSVGFLFMFLAFYGLVSVISDISKWFTR